MVVYCQNMNNSNAYCWGLLARFAPQAIFLLTTMILARLVTPEAFGTIGVLAVIFSVANILLDSGLGGSLIKEKEISDIDCSTISIFNIIVSLLIYIILFYVADYLQSYFNIEGLSSVIRTISWVFPISAFGIVPLSLLKRRLLFNKIFICSISGVIVASFSAVIVALCDGDVYALVTYQIVVNAVNVILYFYFSDYKLSFKFSYVSLRRLIPFGFFTSVVTIVDTVYENIMTVLTGKYLDIKTAGYLYQAKRLEESTSTSMSVAVGVVAFPILTRIKEDLEAFRVECKKTYDTITLLLFPILTLVSVFSKDIINILFGKQWIPSAAYLKILMICGLFIMTEQLMLSFIKALGKVKNLMYLTLVKRTIGLTLLICCLLLDPTMLIYGYLSATIIGCCFNIYLFAKVSNSEVSHTFMLFARNLIMPFLFVFICKTISVFINGGYIYMIGISLVFLSLYYTTYLKHRGINIVSFVKNTLRQ